MFISSGVMDISWGTSEDVVCSRVKCLEQNQAWSTDQEHFAGLLVKEKENGGQIASAL